MLSLIGPDGTLVFESEEDLHEHVKDIPTLTRYVLYDVYPAMGTWDTAGLLHLAQGEDIRTYKDWWND